MPPGPPPRIVIKRADGSVTELEWTQPIISIGRDRANDMVIDHLLASRRHAQFERTDSGYVIRDLSSTNGTYVNSQRIDGAVLLHNQDQVIVGDAVITFHDPEATVRGPLPAELLQTAREELRVDSQTKEVYIRGKMLRPSLTVKEFQLLELLYKRKGQVVSKEDIARAVWDYDVFDYNAIDALVYRLRQRVETSPTNPRYLQTQRGFGYKLVTLPEESPE